MVKTYSLKKNGDEFITKHFRVREIACKDGTDKCLGDLVLFDKLEELRAALNCSKITINSGYRTPAWDKKSGGSGSGFHTKGQAADIKCYGQDGKIISAKTVCCTAQDLGFNGIGYINAESSHVDTGGRVWRGDETIKVNGVYKSVPDFYTYFKIDAPHKTPAGATSDIKTPLYPEPTKNLTLGDTGDGVKWIQERLNMFGANLTIDGKYGAQTFAAVRRFQQDMHLIVDGIVGVKTREKLKN